MSQSSVLIGKDAWNTFNAWWTAWNFSSVFILVDEKSALHCLPVFLEQSPQIQKAAFIKILSGESNKTLVTTAAIWEQLSLKSDRNSLLINLGGGVITDIGGFAAACFKRGIPFVNIPTTLLAMVDAAIGGKTGIDFMGLKNEIGVFHPAERVVIDPVFLKTLPERELKAGFAEMLKHGLIADAAYWKQLTAKAITAIDTTAWTDLIEHSLTIKSEIVAADPLDKGLRQALNFGHTIGHALESYSLQVHADKPVVHGEAVAAGMLMEAYIAEKQCGLAAESLAEIQKVICAAYPYIAFEADPLIALMQHDKKNQSGIIKMALIRAIGTAKIAVETEIELIQAAFIRYKQAYGKA